MAGISSRQGPHQVAQKLSRTGFPRCPASLSVSPLTREIAQSDACLGLDGRIRSSSRAASSTPLTLAAYTGERLEASVAAEAGSRCPSVTTAKSATPMRATPAINAPVSISLPRTSASARRSSRRNPEKVYPYTQSAICLYPVGDLLRLGRLL